jgi:hypothetical protein
MIILQKNTMNLKNYCQMSVNNNFNNQIKIMKKTTLISVIIIAILSALYRNFGQDRMWRSEEQSAQISSGDVVMSTGSETEEQEVVSVKMPAIDTGAVYKRIWLKNPEKFQIEPYFVFVTGARDIWFTGKTQEDLENSVSNGIINVDNDISYRLSWDSVIFSNSKPYVDDLIDTWYFFKIEESKENDYARLSIYYSGHWSSSTWKHSYGDAMAKMKKGVFTINWSESDIENGLWLSKPLLKILNMDWDNLGFWWSYEYIFSEIKAPHRKWMEQSKAYIVIAWQGSEPDELQVFIYWIKNWTIFKAAIVIPYPVIPNRDRRPSSEVYDFQLSWNESKELVSQVNYRRKCLKDRKLNSESYPFELWVCAVEAYYSTPKNKQFAEKVAKELIERFEFAE